MADALLVAVIDGFQNLTEDMRGILLREVFLLNDSLEQLSSRTDPTEIRDNCFAYSMTR
jgi:hypothetical protein